MDWRLVPGGRDGIEVVGVDVARHLGRGDAAQAAGEFHDQEDNVEK
jgi:hypothetical protein